MKTAMILVYAGCLLVTTVAEAGSVVIDPDAFPAGTILNNVFAGVTLTALGDPGVLLNSDVVALTSSYASTGDRLFGDNDANGFYDSWGDGFYDWLRVDFHQGAVTVSLDFGTNNSGDNNAVLKAFDSLGSLVDQDGPSYVPGPQGTYRTLSVSAPYIAYVEAHWDEITRMENGYLDHLVYTPVPEPISALLLALGGLAMMRRRKRA